MLFKVAVFLTFLLNCLMWVYLARSHFTAGGFVSCDPTQETTTKGGHSAMQMAHPIPVTTSPTKDGDGQYLWGWFWKTSKSMQISWCSIDPVAWVTLFLYNSHCWAWDKNYSHLVQWKMGTSKNKNKYSFFLYQKGSFPTKQHGFCGGQLGLDFRSPKLRGNADHGHREKTWHINNHIRNHSQSFQPKATPFCFSRTLYKHNECIYIYICIYIIYIIYIYI